MKNVTRGHSPGALLFCFNASYKQTDGMASPIYSPLGEEGWKDRSG